MDRFLFDFKTNELLPELSFVVLFEKAEWIPNFWSFGVFIELFESWFWTYVFEIKGT